MQNQNLFSRLFTALILGGSFAACRETPKMVVANAPITTPLPAFIQPLRADLNPTFITKNFDASQPIFWQRKDGSSVRIAKKSLCKADGTPFLGNVRLRFRAFHDALSIALAGIPMTHNGGNFTTAGSFELRAEDAQTGETLGLLPQQKAHVALRASGETKGEYPFFYLNENERRWDSLGKSDLERKNSQRIVKTITRQSEPVKKEDLFAFNYLAILDVFYNDDWQILGAATATDSVSKILNPKLAKYGLGYENTYISNRHNIKWEGNDYPASLFVWKRVDHQIYPKWINDQVLKFKNIENNRYELTAKNDSTDAIFRAEVEAVMPLKALFAVAPEVWKNNRDVALAVAKREILVENERIERFSSLYRTFSVEKFGIYNWDKIMKDDQNVLVNAQIEFQTPMNEQTTKPDLTMLTGDEKGVVSLPKNCWTKMPLRPDSKARIFAILPNQRVALYSAKRYASLNFADLRAHQNPTLPTQRFNFEEKIIENEADLRKFLGL